MQNKLTHLKSFIVQNVTRWNVDNQLKKISIQAKVFVLPEKTSNDINFIELMTYCLQHDLPIIIEKEDHFKSFDSTNKFVEEGYFYIVCDKCILHFWEKGFDLKDSPVEFIKIFTDLEDSRNFVQVK